MNKNNLYLDFKLPKIYNNFLDEISNSPSFFIEGTGIILYKKTELLERNNAYQIQDYEPDFLMIAQEGDLAFFIKNDEAENIYSNDLGALGSLEMEYVSENIIDFIQYAKENYDDF